MEQGKENKRDSSFVHDDADLTCRYGWDDYIAFSCFFASTGTLAMLVKVQQNGFGRDMYTLEDPNELSRFLFVSMISGPVFFFRNC